MANFKMPEVNYVMLAGNLVKDPIYRQTANNITVVNFFIASNRKFRDSAGEWQEDVCYIGVVGWNRLAESCRANLRKGSAVLIDGELQSRHWVTDEGFNRSVIEIKARRIQFLNRGYRSNGHKYGNNENSNDTGANTVLDESETDYTGDSFDKFLSSEESDLLK